MKTYQIAVLPGDGVGKEVLPEALKVLAEVSRLDGGFKLETEVFPWNSEYYFKYGQMMPDHAIDTLSHFDAILLGALGDPRVPDYIPVQVVFKIRRSFEQYINLRPIKVFQGISSCPLKEEVVNGIDMVFVRENTEGEYGDIGGRHNEGTENEVVLQTNIFTRRGTERVMRYAFKLAIKRSRKLTSVTKSNALKHSMVFWDEVFDSLKPEYPDVETKRILVDAMAMFMMTKPKEFDVVVASNLFGDILTDLGAGYHGGLGLAPGGNINPEKKHPSMFEPIHGSAPDIAGKSIANPLATIWAGQMMLEHLGEEQAARLLIGAIEKVVSEGRFKTRDLGGNCSTQKMGDAVATKVNEICLA